jgi:hypothetical protein
MKRSPVEKTKKISVWKKKDGLPNIPSPAPRSVMPASTAAETNSEIKNLLKFNLY